MKKQLITLFAVLLGLGGSLFAQNQIVNGDFESTSIYGAITPPSYTDYQRVNANYVVEYGHYVINNTTSGHGGGQGWPMLNNSHGKFMIVNGYGGNSNPTKVVWRQTINVTTQTNYTFSYRYVNLNTIYYGQINPAKLQVKINGTNFGGVNTLPTNNDWHSWNNNGTKWNSGNATQAVIEIFDTYTGNEGLGDDFCIDDISFVPDVVYSVTANADNVNVCLNTPQNIYVLENDEILPNNQGVELDVVIDPQYGVYMINNDAHYIQYVYTGGGSGTDQFKYSATTHGVTSEAWVFVTTNTPPVVGNVAQPGPICDGGSLGIDPPSVSPYAEGVWKYCSTPNGTNWQTFDPLNVPISMNGKYIRYYASNSCGEGHSNNNVQITVTNGPTFSGQTPQIQPNPICAGANLNMTPPAYNANGSQILSYGWVASPTENGEYTSFSLNNISASYNGWFIRYMVESSCGFVYSSPARQLTVNVAPDVTGTLQAPEAICAGGNLEVTPPEYTGNNVTGSWEICQSPNGNYVPFSINNVPFSYNNWYLHYKVSNDCGNDVSNYVQIHVNDAPTIGTPATPPAICAGNSLSLTTPSIQNNGSTPTNQGWQIQLNGTWQTLNNSSIPYSYNGCQIRYFVESSCGDSYSPSVQLTVNDEPIVGNITTPAAICAGESFTLTTPQVTWRHNDPSTCSGSWEISENQSGPFAPFNNNNVPFSNNGYFLRYKAINGCGSAYSSNVVQITVYSTEPIDEGELTACAPMYHYDVYCDHTGPYSTQITSSEGCLRTVSWHFTLGDAYVAPEQVETECDSYYWPRTHKTYYVTGIYDTIVYSNDPQICDSTFTLNLTINNDPEILENISSPSAICAGWPLGVSIPQYAMHHAEGGSYQWEYSTTANGPWTVFDPSSNNISYGDYYLHFKVVNGCGYDVSNTVPFRVNDKPEILMELSNMQVCEGDPLDLPDVIVNWKNDDESDRIAEWQMSTTENGGFSVFDPTMPMQASNDGNWIRFRASNSCGEVILGPVYITVNSVEDQYPDPIIACDSYQLPSGETITQSQTIDYNMFEPCPYVIHQDYIINHSNFKVDSLTSCHDEFVWHGRTFYRTDYTQYAWDTLQNVTNCDSIVELHLNFGDYAIITETVTACDSYVWPRKPDQVYTESQIDSYFINSEDDMVCDSMIYLNLTIGHTWEVIGDPKTECSGFVWNGVAYDEDAVLVEHLYTTHTHCDSIVTYDLTIIPPYERDTTVVSCKPFWWQGHHFETDGDFYQYTFQSVPYGCDSVVTMHFELAGELTSQSDTLVCTPFYWYDNECNHEGMFSHLFETSQGCDSTVYLYVTFNETEVQSENHSACNEYLFHGQLYLPGFHQIYYDTLYTQNGCDSIVHCLNLTVTDSQQLGSISGSPSVYVASSLTIGVYRYEIDTEGLTGPVDWSLSNPDWLIVESGIDFCRVLVTTPGTATLTAHFNVADCGEMERTFNINAVYFGVDDHQEMEVRIFPNPTRGTLTVEAEGIKRVRVIDMMGQTLEVQECGKQDQTTLNLNALAPSVYILEIETVNGMVKKRVIVCR